MAWSSLCVKNDPKEALQPWEVFIRTIIVAFTRTLTLVYTPVFLKRPYLVRVVTAAETVACQRIVSLSNTTWFRPVVRSVCIPLPKPPTRSINTTPPTRRETQTFEVIRTPWTLRIQIKDDINDIEWHDRIHHLVHVREANT